ncbi:hypothetical protein [Flaviaesturariibacter aridisoli]|uniref:Uncharacterized protein n=1 Tax=Flaviaesturariibacter aridisoli TaxID=2545761 RepID=A0A4R4E4Q1_9BACT|nr:hypothetical protein [Flaviaesturariibacter aridisoli]TCZ72200.1 hypothetical protein E0486_08900 [Flaviaesturariibacter aridisoli]
MIRRINQYLRIHHPLLWNTRVLWVLLANLCLYLIFFLAGFLTVQARSIATYYSVWFVGGFGLPAFSTLCTVLVVVLWLLYYLRNNAFKNFYRIGRFHLLREFALILLIFFSSGIYYEFYMLGVQARVRTITSEATFVKELNQLNEGLAFVPTERAPYFLFNSCSAQKEQLPTYYENTTYLPGSDEYASDSNYRMIADAVRRPDAFSYNHYCTLAYLYTQYGGLDSSLTVAQRVQALIQGGRRDGIRRNIEAVEAICRKYGVRFRLNEAALVEAPFVKPYNAVPAWVPDSEERYAETENGTPPNPYYLETGSLRNAMSFVNDCLSDAEPGRFLAIAYVSLGCALLLFTWRRFSRKVFLVAVVGALVWPIVIGLFGFAWDFEESGFYLFLLLIGLFLGGALLRMRSPGRTFSGALLAWHAWTFPYIGFLFLGMVERYLSYHYSREAPSPAPPDWRELHYPVASWVDDHGGLISLAWWIVSVLYTGFVLNALARRWQALPQE